MSLSLIHDDFLLSFKEASELYHGHAERQPFIDYPNHLLPAAPEEKFKAWATTVPHTLRNSLYNWAHLESLRVFGIKSLLTLRLELPS